MQAAAAASYQNIGRGHTVLHVSSRKYTASHIEGFWAARIFGLTLSSRYAKRARAPSHVQDFSNFFGKCPKPKMDFKKNCPNPFPRQCLSKKIWKFQTFCKQFHQPSTILNKFSISLSNFHTTWRNYDSFNFFWKFWKKIDRNFQEISKRFPICSFLFSGNSFLL